MTDSGIKVWQNNLYPRKDKENIVIFSSNELAKSGKV